MGPAIATDREDVAFDAAAAELEAIEEDDLVPAEPEPEAEPA